MRNPYVLLVIALAVLPACNQPFAVPDRTEPAGSPLEQETAVDRQIELVAPGIWKLTLGTPEAVTPVQLRETEPAGDALGQLANVSQPPFLPEAVGFRAAERGCMATLPLGADEEIYGFGLQLKSHRQTGLKRTCRVNADPTVNTGDTHAPVPFYVSTAGYGVYVDTARYASFYCGTHPTIEAMRADPQPDHTEPLGSEGFIQNRLRDPRAMMIDVPCAQGVDIYILAGPTMKEAVRRYVLFSGGGCLPPMWGLGVWYRGEMHFTADQAADLAKSFRDSHIPCDVFGLEPGWQTNTYPCTYVWSDKRFPEPAKFLDRMKAMNFKVNLWEHAFVHNASPIFKELEPLAGDYPAMNGIVPDLSLPEARKVFADHHDTELIAKGVAGFKLDECDNSDLVWLPWSFPELSQFPSGMDGEQMHSMIGILYQRTIEAIYRQHNRRTLGQVRSSHALAAPFPFVLYSDLYDHRDFVRGVVNAGFTGLLWSPELRHSDSVEDLKRRLQTVTFSPQALINAWYITSPPWKQVNREMNNAGQFLDNWQAVEADCREILQWRMRLLPYLYSAFARYREDGTPPFRALVMDWPDDPQTYDVDNEYMCGDALLIAPMFTGQNEREVYLPAGTWYDFWTHAPYEGGKKHTIQADVDTIPVFARSGFMVPVADPVDSVADDTVFELTVQTFGPACRPFTLFEDDGVSYDYEKGRSSRVTLTWNKGRGQAVLKEGTYPRKRYNIKEWQHIGAE